MFRLIGSVLILTFVSAALTACAPPVLTPLEPAPPTSAPPLEREEMETSGVRLAAFFPWVIIDGDYNNLGYVALLTAQNQHQADVTYLQSVDPAELQDSMRVMVEQGYRVLWAHGTQFLGPALDFARQNPEVIVIVEQEEEIPYLPPNVWVIDRNFHEGFYVLGVLATRASRTGKIGYLGGPPFENAFAEAHAVEQAVDDASGQAQLQTVWTGDFNDAEAARRATDRLIADGIDFFIGSLNQGIFGVLEAAKAQEGRALVTSKYTDKTAYAPEQHVTTLLFDFSVPLGEILTRVESGETGGVVHMAFGHGIALVTPLHNVDPSLQAEIEVVIAAIQAGEIEVRQDFSPVP